MSEQTPLEISSSTPTSQEAKDDGSRKRRKLFSVESRRKSLTYFNAAMCVFHALLTGVTLGLGNLNLAVPVYDLDYELEITVSNGTSGGGEESRAWKLVPRGGSVVMDLHFTWMTAAFFAISAIFHFANAVVWRKWYLDGIDDCRCPSRWIEYSFSASLMSVLIAYGAGLNILLLLVAVFFLSMTTMFFGHLTELLARPADSAGEAWTRPWGHRLQAHFMGYVPQLCAWYIILWQFHSVAAKATSSDGQSRMPNFVYGIVWGELFVFWSFGAIQLVFTSLPPKQYVYGEVSYQIMSLVSKGLLGLILIVNVLMLSDFEDIYN